MKKAWLIVLLGLLAPVVRGQQSTDYDLVIYGGTAAAVTAAVQARQMNRSVVIVSPDKHLGGLSSGGLGFTDTGNKAVIGGLAREFYHRVWQHYNRPEAWTWEKREAFGNKGQGTPAMDGENRTMWIFEPHVAEEVFEGFIREYQIPVLRDEWLDRKSGVRKQGARIVSIRTLSGKLVRDITANLSVRSDPQAQGKARKRWCCAGCANDLGPTSENYKLACTMLESPVTASNPHVGDPKRYIDPVPVFRQFFCPSCGRLIENEIALSGDPILQDIEIAA